MKICIECETELIEDVNWASYCKKARRNVCKDCLPKWRHKDYLRNKKTCQKWYQKWTGNIADIWRDGAKKPKDGNYMPRARRTEKIALKLLEQKGFYDIKDYCKAHLPFDFLARKEEQEFAICVTTSNIKHRSQTKHKVDSVVDFFGCKWLTIFINPTFKWYLFKEDTTGEKIFLSKSDLEHLKKI